MWCMSNICRLWSFLTICRVSLACRVGLSDLESTMVLITYCINGIQPPYMQTFVFLLYLWTIRTILIWTGKTSKQWAGCVPRWVRKGKVREAKIILFVNTLEKILVCQFLSRVNHSLRRRLAPKVGNLICIWLIFLMSGSLPEDREYTNESCLDHQFFWEPLTSTTWLSQSS